MTTATVSLQAVEPSVPDSTYPPEGVFDQQWMEVFLLGQKVGYAHILFEFDGDKIVHRNNSWMKIARDRFVMEIAARYTTTESLDGIPQAFSHTLTLAGQPVIASGTVQDGQVDYHLSQGTYTLNESVEFPEGALMAWGARSLAEAQGIEPGTEYTYKLYSPDLDYKRAAQVNVVVKGWEPFAFQGKKRMGIRRDETLFIGGTELKTQSWVDEEGRGLKTTLNMAGMPIEMYAADMETALADFVPAELFLSNLFALDKTIPADAREVRFTIRSRSAEGIARLPITSRYQQLRRISPHVVDVVVSRAQHASIDGRNDSRAGLESEVYEKSNLMINVEDPKIQELAQQALPQGYQDRLEAAAALRTFVTDYIDDKNLHVGFASASEVARHPRGDCTEHAVLLAALSRAHGLPARVAGGLVYLPSFGGKQNVMGYHMWTQIYIDEHWIDFDAALGESQCAPTRIALTVASLENVSLTEIGMDLLQYLGQIDVELVDAK